MHEKSQVRLHVKYLLLMADMNNNFNALTNVSKLSLQSVLRHARTISSLIY
jgi:hypothetical protein